MTTRARITIDAYAGAPEWRNIERSSFNIEVDDDDEAIHAIMDELAKLLDPYAPKSECTVGPITSGAVTGGAVTGPQSVPLWEKLNEACACTLAASPPPKAQRRYLLQYYDWLFGWCDDTDDNGDKLSPAAEPSALVAKMQEEADKYQQNYRVVMCEVLADGTEGPVQLVASTQRHE